MFSRKIAAVALAGLAVPVSAQAPTDPGDAPELNAVEALVAAGNFQALTTAVTLAGLADTLSGEGPFTIFAPTDEAFSNVPLPVLLDLIRNPDLLVNVLTYHVAGGETLAGDIFAEPIRPTLQGGQQFFSTDGDTVLINGVRIRFVDYQVSNGVIHVIDEVLLPCSPALPGPQCSAPDLVDELVADGRFSLLVTAVQTAGLEDALRAGFFTVFAPTDEAFMALPDGVLDGLLMDPPALADVLLRHAVHGKVFASKVTTTVGARAANGEFLNFTTDGMNFFVNNSMIEEVDNTARTGAFHVVDEVIFSAE